MSNYGTSISATPYRAQNLSTDLKTLVKNKSAVCTAYDEKTNIGTYILKSGESIKVDSNYDILSIERENAEENKKLFETASKENGLSFGEKAWQWAKGIVTDGIGGFIKTVIDNPLQATLTIGGTIAGIAALNAIPVVGQALSGIALAGLGLYGIYHSVKSGIENIGEAQEAEEYGNFFKAKQEYSQIGGNAFEFGLSVLGAASGAKMAYNGIKSAKGFSTVKNHIKSETQATENSAAATERTQESTISELAAKETEVPASASETVVESVKEPTISIEELLNRINNGEPIEFHDFETLTRNLLVDGKKFYRDAHGKIVVADSEVAGESARLIELEKSVKACLQDDKYVWFKYENFADFKARYIELKAQMDYLNDNMKAIIEKIRANKQYPDNINRELINKYKEAKKAKTLDKFKKEHNISEDKCQLLEKYSREYIVDKQIINEFKTAKKNGSLNSFAEQYNLSEKEVQFLDTYSKDINRVRADYNQHNNLYKDIFKNADKETGSNNKWDNAHKTTKTESDGYTIFKTTTEGKPETVIIKTEAYLELLERLKSDYQFLDGNNEHAVCRLLQRIVKADELGKAYEFLDIVKARMANPFNEDTQVGYIITRSQTNRDAFSYIIKNVAGEYDNIIFGKDGKIITIINDIGEDVVNKYLFKIPLV